MATAFSKRPSEILGLDLLSWAAYQLDLACLKLGRWVENELEERDKQGNRINRLDDLLRSHKEVGSSESASDGDQVGQLPDEDKQTVAPANSPVIAGSEQFSPLAGRVTRKVTNLDDVFP